MVVHAPSTLAHQTKQSVMIRTTIAFSALFGCLLTFSSCVQQSSADENIAPVAFRQGQRRRRESNSYPRVMNAVEIIRGVGNCKTDIGPAPLSSTAIDPLLIPTPKRFDELEQEQSDKDFTNFIRSKQDESEEDDESDSRWTPVNDDNPSELSPEMVKLRDDIRSCLAYYYDRHENANSRSPWGIMHTLIAYGVDTEILVNNRKVNAIGWLCWNGRCRGQRLFYTSHGNIGVNQGPGVEGHQGQFLAMLAQSRVVRDYPLKISGRDFTIEDLVEHEKMTCRPKAELTFKLIGLSHYLDSDTTWTNDVGQEWSISRLIQEELAQPVVGAACGGTHRMMGFSYSVRRRKMEDKEITGQWQRAETFVNEYHDYTLQMQNPDGSFSTRWFEGRGNSSDVEKRVQTTGHILEWLVFSLPEDQLYDERIVRSVEYLTNVLLENRGRSWEIGPRGHALHSLVLYDQRVFGAKPGWRNQKVAELSNESARK